MATHTFEIPDNVYRRLEAEAARRQVTPEQLLEQFLADSGREAHDPDVPAAGSPVALAAVDRLTALFADVTIPDLEHVLGDPALTVANAELGEIDQ